MYPSVTEAVHEASSNSVELSGQGPDRVPL